MSRLKNKKILVLILSFCIFALIFAYFIQYVLGHQPCNLCLIERIPFIFISIILSLCLFLNKFEKISLFVVGITFILATLISFYHFGIEQGFITESLVCDLNNTSKNLTAEEILDELKKRTISCKNVYFKILGLSLATLNTIISLILSVIVLKKYFDYEKD